MLKYVVVFILLLHSILALTSDLGFPLSSSSSSSAEPRRELTIEQAIEEDDLEAIKALVAREPKIIDTHKIGGDSLLFVASTTGHLAIAKFFLEQGAPLTAKDL